MLACTFQDPVMTRQPCIPSVSVEVSSPSMTSNTALVSLIQIMQKQQISRPDSVRPPSLPCVSGAPIAHQAATPNNWAYEPSIVATAPIMPVLSKPSASLTQQPCFSNMSLAKTLELTKLLLSPFANQTHNKAEPEPERVSSSPSDSEPSRSPPSMSPTSPSDSSEDAKAANKSRYWTEREHERFLHAIRIFGAYDHKSIAKYVETRSPGQVRSHSQKFFKKLESFDGQGLPSMARKTYKKRAKKHLPQDDAADRASNTASPTTQ